jgi:hypothetical protein
MSNVHVLRDENLGGVLRECIEVDRPAKEGDLIIFRDDGYDITAGKPYRVVDSRSYTDAVVFIDDADERHVCENPSERFFVTEPTDIVHIDGARYRLVDRKAKVGDRIIIVDGKGWYRDKVGNIYEVIHSSKYGFEEDDDGRAYVEYEKNEYDETIHYVRRENYRVLEPVEPTEEGDDVLTVDETEASKSVLDLLANLAHRLTTLEQQVTRRVTELEQKLNFVKSDVNMVIDDIVTLDERTQPLVALAKAVKADE